MRLPAAAGRLRAGLAILLLCLGVGAPAQDALAPVETPEPSGTIAVEGGGQGQDAAIARRIRGILAALDDYEGVGIAVSEGIVTLTGEATDGAAVARLDEIVSRLEGVVAIENEVRASADVARRLDPAVRRFRERGAQALAFLPLLLIALAALGLVLATGAALSRWRRLWERLAPNRFVADVYAQLVRLAFAVLGVVVALDILGATALLGTILGAAGILGLAVGFAVRDTIENFIASVMLSFRQPFRPSDLVEIEGDLGKVIRLTSRATILLDLDGNQIRIPNATVFKARIVNYTRNRERRFQFEIGVASDADLAAVRDLATRTVAEMPFALAEPAPMVWIDRIGDGAIFLQVTGWIDQEKTDFLRARGEALRLVKVAVEAVGVEVPDTTYRVQLLGHGAAEATAAQGASRPASGATEPAAAAPVPPTAGRALERLVVAERGAPRGSNLLSAHAPEE